MISLGDVERSMLETYGTTYDLTEESSLEPLVAREFIFDSERRKINGRYELKCGRYAANLC